ncbi:MAG: hypothetical protein JO363_00020 [Solirubrobacterales bacterium]|nr:hypothetical protein [Solirubrobacterales bacterium]
MSVIRSIMALDLGNGPAGAHHPQGVTGPRETERTTKDMTDLTVDANPAVRNFS